MKHIQAGVLDIAYAETGPSDGIPVMLMHGFPYDVHAYDQVSEMLAAEGFRCIAPYLRGYGPTRFLSEQTPRSGQQAALGADLLALMDALEIESAILGGYDWGGRAACIVAALWPERVRGLVSCGVGYNIQNIAQAVQPVEPEEEHRYWYIYYFHTERGRNALEMRREDLTRYIWQIWSPTWKFGEDTFQRTAESFSNPDFVDIVIHSYTHRFGGVPGDPALEEIEKRLAAHPDISVPAIVLLGADDGVDPPGDQDQDAKHFKGPYERKVVPGAGHNLPQETPEAFARAVIDIARGETGSV
ncbi:MAG: alpha/beta fold hydrolase [Hyphomicrobiales bacterium]